MAKAVPAIVRDWSDEDREPLVMSIPYDGVTNSPGLGDMGYRIEVVEHECPVCGFDRMVRRHDVSPESPDEVRYYCLNPNCAHFVRDEFSHACHGNYPQTTVEQPAVVQERSD